MEFLKAFLDIDSDNDGVVTQEDLIRYRQEKNYSEKFDTKWLALFDTDNDGVIKIEEFREVLGFKGKEDFLEEEDEIVASTTVHVKSLPPARPNDSSEEIHDECEAEKVDVIMSVANGDDESKETEAAPDAAKIIVNFFHYDMENNDMAQFIISQVLQVLQHTGASNPSDMEKRLAFVLNQRFQGQWQVVYNPAAETSIRHQPNRCIHFKVTNEHRFLIFDHKMAAASKSCFGSKSKKKAVRK